MVSIPRRTGSTETDRADGTAGARRGGLLGAALAGFAAGAIGYLAFGRRGTDASLPASGDVRETAEEVRETVGEAVPEAVPIGSPGEAADGESASTDDAGETADVPLETPSTDRSDRELRERASEDAEAEPAEPGEMTVDEEVVEDIVDEEDGGA